MVLTTQRSGSSRLVDLRDDHPSITAYRELVRVPDTKVSGHGADTVRNFEVMVDPDTFSVFPRLALKRHPYRRGLVRAHPAGRDATR